MDVKVPHIINDAQVRDPYKGWYDNPDIKDFVFSMFGLASSKFADLPSQCLHFYDKSRKQGLNQFVLDEDVWRAGELVNTLEGRIVYHPVVSVTIPKQDNQSSSLEERDVTTMNHALSSILDGIDGVNGDNGMPKVIIVPILMQTNHFGTLVIKPTARGANPEVYYFNSLGTLNPKDDYMYDERLIFNFIESRYGKGTSINHNGELVWQTDSNQCGPYTIWFVQQIAELVRRDQLDVEHVRELLDSIWNMGVPKKTGEDLTQMEQDRLRKVQEIRGEQAELLKFLSTNFSTNLFLQFRFGVEKALGTRSMELLKFSDVRFNQNSTACGEALLSASGMKIWDVEGVDTFELQPEMRDMVLTYINTYELATNTLVR